MNENQRKFISDKLGTLGNIAAGALTLLRNSVNSQQSIVVSPKKTSHVWRTNPQMAW